jgi:hypothetical protein
MLISGCSSSQNGASTESKNQTVATGTVVPVVSTSSVIITPSPTIVTSQKVMETLGPLKTIKDPELWFTMQVPASWDVSTEQLPNPEGYEGLVYVTYLYNNPVLFNTHEFYILTYAITRNFDQAIRDTYRKRKMNESTVIIHGITFDRFESKSDDNVYVVYVVRKSSANERGFASLIEYSLNSSSNYQQNDYESLISTFRYVTARDIPLLSGEEIKRPNGIPLFR